MKLPPAEMPCAKAVLYIAGLARCGSTLTMQMLSAGGMPCVGSAPDWEVAEVNHRVIDQSFVLKNLGHAIKIIDPLLTGVPDGVPAFSIWLDRDHREQARSHMKFIRSAMPNLPPANRREIRRVAKNLARDVEPSIRALAHTHLTRISFERILAFPAGYAHLLARVARVGMGIELDVEAMAKCVIKRPASCAPDISIEIAAARRAQKIFS